MVIELTPTLTISAFVGLIVDEAIDRFLSHLIPGSMNVYFSTRDHPADSTPLIERWYGAKYGVQALSQVCSTNTRISTERFLQCGRQLFMEIQ